MHATTGTRRARIPRAVVAGAALLIGAPALAGPLTISPTTVEIQPGHHSATVEVVNGGDQPTDLQFRAYAWAQRDGRDELTETDRVAVSPAIVTVPAHARQVFRVFDLDDTPLAGERSFRLRLNELPRGDTRAIAINLEFSIPVFATPPGAVADLAWSASDGGIRVTNTGTRRIRLARLALQLPGGGSADLAGAGSSYLLAGSTRTYPVRPPAARVVADRLVGTGDSGAINVSNPVLATR